MSSNKHIAALAIAGATVLSPAVANAACTQGQLAGTWAAYAAGSSGAKGNWVRCEFKVNSTGAFAPASCPSTDGLGNTVPLTLSSGKITMTTPAKCTFTGHFVLQGKTYTIVHATLARDQLMATGVGTLPLATFVFMLTKI
jgi:hypothetical protein